MKKIFVAMVAASMVLGGCTKGDEVAPSTEMATVTFSAANTVEVRGTRAGGQDYTGVIGINDVSVTAEDVTTTSSWEVAPSALSFTGNLSAASTGLAISQNDTAVTSVEIKSTGINNAYFYAVGVAEGTVAVDDATNNTVALVADEDATSLANDYIYAKVAQPVNGGVDNVVAFPFNHVMAKLRIEVYEQTTDNDRLTENVEISNIANLGLVRDGSLNFLNGKVTPGTTTLQAAVINNEYYVLPQAITAGKAFTIEFQGKEYTVTMPANLELVANKCLVLPLVISGSGVTFTATLVDWTDEVAPEFDLTPDAEVVEGN